MGSAACAGPLHIVTARSNQHAVDTHTSCFDLIAWPPDTPGSLGLGPITRRLLDDGSADDTLGDSSIRVTADAYGHLL